VRAKKLAQEAPWPTAQRFDVLVRTRPLTAAEAALPTDRTLARSANGEALRFAIEGLSANR
jgi:hypothetical protein